MRTRMSHALAATAALLAVALGGASRGDDRVPATGTVRGTITIDGKSQHHKLALDDTVVSLKGGELKSLSRVPTEPAVMDQNGIAYIPTALAIVAGTTVEFRNSDPTLHNVHCQCRANKPFNLGMNKGETTKIVFAAPETVEVTCNIHATMKAFIVVLENSFFTKADAKGAFKIENVPAGELEIRAWHDGTTPTVQKVIVKPGAETVVDLDLATRKRR